MRSGRTEGACMQTSPDFRLRSHPRARVRCTRAWEWACRGAHPWSTNDVPACQAQVSLARVCRDRRIKLDALDIARTASGWRQVSLVHSDLVRGRYTYASAGRGPNPDRDHVQRDGFKRRLARLDLRRILVRAALLDLDLLPPAQRTSPLAAARTTAGAWGSRPMLRAFSRLESLARDPER
jgi:hypothetical protein